MSQAAASPASKKPIYKRVWFLALAAVIVLIVIVSLSSGGSGSNNPSNSNASSGSSNVSSGSSNAGSSGNDGQSHHKAATKNKHRKAAPSYTVAQQSAIQSAQSYLSMGTGFSRAGLIQQLSSKAGEGFTKADAVFAVDHIKVNWNKQALESARGYMQMGGFSAAGLMQQLTSKAGEQFTVAQATYAVDHVGLSNPGSSGGDNGQPYTVAQQSAIQSAQSYLSMGTGFSRAGLIQQLSSKAGEGFTKADAVFAVDHIKVNWNKQALESARGYMQMGGFSRAGLMQQLTSKAGEQFTVAQATYAVDHVGL